MTELDKTTPADEDVQTQDGKNKGEEQADKPGQETKPTTKTFSQEEVDDMIKRRLEREKVKSDKAAQDAAKRAELKTLADQQEWQSLAEKRQEMIMDLESKVNDLNDQAERADQYERLLKSYRDKLLEGVPDNIQVILKNLDLVSQFEWLKTYKPEQEQAPKGPPMTPGRQDTARLTDEEKRRQGFAVRF